jgi:hypothetical protein
MIYWAYKIGCEQQDLELVKTTAPQLKFEIEVGVNERINSFKMRDKHNLNPLPIGPKPKTMTITSNHVQLFGKAQCLLAECICW